MTNSVDPDEVAHNEPPHQDLHCLLVQLFSSMALKVLIKKFEFPLGIKAEDSSIIDYPQCVVNFMILTQLITDER